MTKRFILALTLALTLAAGCKNNGEKILPSISGKPGEVAVVCSKTQWEGEPGTTIRALLSDEVPFLPQVEPMYDLFNVPQQAFGKLFRVHRNIIFLDIDPKYKESSVATFADVWATPQLVINITAETPAKAAELISQRGDKIISILEQTERSRLLGNIREFENAEIYDTVKEMFGGAPHFPNGYTIKKKADDFIWISYEPTYSIQSVLIWKYPYVDETSLSAEALAAKRNEITREHIPCTMEGSYMILNPDIFPGCRNIETGGRAITELRGLWEAHNDFMGGPFLSHSFLSPDGSEVITLDAFVYAPRYDKRNYLRQVEAILYTYE